MCPKAVPKADLSRIRYKKYRVALQFLSKLDGGVPKDPNMIRRWLETSGASKAELYQESAIKNLDPATSTGETIEDFEKGSWSGFLKDDDGRLYIESRLVGAALKEAANIL